jgi:hypothetical protein
MNFLHNFLKFLIVYLIGLIVTFVAFNLYPNIYANATNADSLTLFDFSHDVLNLNNISNWNLPRAPFLFPDGLVALFSSLTGLSSTSKIILVGSVNVFLLFTISYLIIKSAGDLKKISIFNCIAVISFSFIFIVSIFPISLGNIFWQIFGSGTHFGVTIFSLLIIFLLQDSHLIAIKNSKLRLFFIGIIIIAISASNSMALAILFLWVFSTMLNYKNFENPVIVRILLVFITCITGLLLSQSIPKQPMAGFFTIDKFINSISQFLNFLFNNPSTFFFIIFLLVTNIIFPFLLRNKSIKELSFEDILDKYFAYLIPSLGIIFISPLFYEGPGSLRYLIFPSYISMISISLIYIRVISIGGFRFDNINFIFTVTLLITISIFLKDFIKKIPAENFNSFSSYSCVINASKQLDIKDGIATYWNVRPIRFLSEFKLYLAQVQPWDPKGGFFFWGNNLNDFVYKDYKKDILRNYNYIYASNDEINSKSWGSILSKSENIYECANGKIYFYNDASILFKFLFPNGPPNQLPISDTFSKLIPAFNDRIFDAFDLNTQVGVKEKSSIVSNGVPGYLVFGPYITLSPGRYKLIAKGSLIGENSVIGKIDVVTNLGKDVISQKDIKSTFSSDSTDIVALEFSLLKPESNIEFRININGNTVGNFYGYILKKN